MNVRRLYDTSGAPPVPSPATPVRRPVWTADEFLDTPRSPPPPLPRPPAPQHQRPRPAKPAPPRRRSVPTVAEILEGSASLSRPRQPRVPNAQHPMHAQTTQAAAPRAPEDGADRSQPPWCRASRPRRAAAARRAHAVSATRHVLAGIRAVASARRRRDTA